VRIPRIPILRLGQSAGELEPPRLTAYAPALSLENLQVGVDNLRHDVYLSAKFVESARVQIAHRIARHGEVDTLLSMETAISATPSHFLERSGPARVRTRIDAAELKPLLADMLVSTLTKAKMKGNLSVDVLGRLAVLKFLRSELQLQFSQVLEQCRILLKGLDGMRQQAGMAQRERVADYQVRKKITIRKTGQDIFQILREIEKETLARMRRSLFGDVPNTAYQLFLNPLVFSDDGRDDYLGAQHYVMLGNFDRDVDRFPNVRRIACEFVQSLNLGDPDSATVDSWLNAPENAYEILGDAHEGSSPEAKARRIRLQAWIDLLEREQILDPVIASYEAVPLLAEYAPRINPQQLKNALLSRAECNRVVKMIDEHGKLTPDSLYAAMDRVGSCRGTERAKIAVRFLRDLLCFHRDLRRLEALNAGTDSVNLIGNDKLRELSAVNGTLYDFLLPDEQRPTEERILHHVILKADIRDSSRLTRSLMERDLNPASYFSLNFYDPVNKLLSKYGANKVFLEGDAIILALLEKEGEPAMAVSRACVLAREIIDIVRGYNETLARSGLPNLEIGIGISYQQSAPLYLMDGNRRIMISDAVNESDRLSSCNKRVRKAMGSTESVFHVFTFQTVSDSDAGENTEDFTLRFNVGGICMNEAAFQKLQHEVSISASSLRLPLLWNEEGSRILSALVPLGNDIFRKIAVRESRVAQIDLRSFSLQRWTDRRYYEVCADPTVYAELEKKSEGISAASRSSAAVGKS
jgi:class 3 adenylate cyclase